jgi:ABC-type uncharacterized transport system ATPase subunit
LTVDPPIVSMKKITKTFPGVVANDQVSLDLFPQEIHVILGENGAGKTTLMNILYGFYKPDAGEIAVDNKLVKMRSPVDAQSLGIGMVFQHFSLIEIFTVLENFTIGRKTKGIRLNLSELESKVKESERQYNIHVDLNRKVEDLSIAEKQKAEILKILFRGARILILDEPTSMLTPQETEALFKSLSTLKNQGKSIVLITHKLYEILEIADRVTVLRGGRVVFRSGRDGLTAELLAEAAMGRSMEIEEVRREEVKSKGSLVVKEVSAKGERGETSVSRATFEVQRGQIVGVAGIAGNGQRELVEALVGLRKVESGNVLIDGIDVTGKGVRARIRLGLRYIPEDRRRRGVAIDLPLIQNAVLRDHWHAPYEKDQVIRFKPVRDFAKRIVSEFNVVASSEFAVANELSGGNLQKFIVGREFLSDSRYIVAENPTAGLDVASTSYVRDLLVDYRNAGKGVLLVSGDLDELLTISDRILVMYRGKTSNYVEREQFDKLKIGALMLGESFHQPQSAENTTIP